MVEWTDRLDFLNLLFELPILCLIFDILCASSYAHDAALLLFALIVGGHGGIVNGVGAGEGGAGGGRTRHHGGDEGRREVGAVPRASPG